MIKQGYTYNHKVATNKLLVQNKRLKRETTRGPRNVRYLPKHRKICDELDCNNLQPVTVVLQNNKLDDGGAYHALDFEAGIYKKSFAGALRDQK